MTQYNFTNQDTEHSEVAPKIPQLKNRMNDRKEIWDKLSHEQKKQWIQSEKDPVMDLAWTMFKYLRNNFFEDSLE